MESVSVRLFDAIARQDLDAIRAELAGGVDLHCVDTWGQTLIVAAHRAMLSSEASVAWEIMAAILDAGYQPTEPEAYLVAPLNSQYQQWDPDFLAIMEQLHQIFSEHHRDYLGPGTQLFAGWKGAPPPESQKMRHHNWAISYQREQSLSRQLNQEFEEAFSPIIRLTRQSGFVLMRGGRQRYQKGKQPSGGAHEVHLFPTADQYVAVAQIGLGDWWVGSGPEAIIPKLKMIESQWPFQIFRCSPRSLGLEFQSPLRDAEGLIRELKASFFIDYWYTDEEIMTSAKQLNGQRRLSVKFGLM